MKYFVEIPEVHKVVIEVELPGGTSCDQIILAAQDKFMNIDLEDYVAEYSHTLEPDEWTVRTKDGKIGEENGSIPN